MSPPDVGEASTEEPESGVLRGAARVAVLLTVAGTIGQVFTLIRELFVASQVGTSPSLDALLVAAVVPIMVASLLVSGTSSAIVPAYLATAERLGFRAADQLLGATLSWTAIVSVAATMLVILGAEVVISISGPGLDPASHRSAVGYVPILAPMLLFSALGGLLAAVFQIHDRMRAIAVAWLAGPVASVVVTVGLWNAMGMAALALAMTIQQVVIVVIMVVLAIGMRILPHVTVRADRAEIGRFLKHATPLTISSSVLQLNLLTDRAIATLIAPGAVSALRYAEGIVRLPMNAIGPAWSAAIYPALVRASHLSESRSLGEAASGAIRYVTVIFVPLSVATAAMAPLIVQVAYARGAFDQHASVLTAGALAGFAPLLFLTMANSVLTGAHNARRRGLFLMSMGFLNAILNAVFNVGLGLLIGVAGIALSTSLTVGIVQFIKAWRLGTLDEAFPLGLLLRVSAKAIAASLAVALPVSAIAWNLPAGLTLPAHLALLVVLSVGGMVGYIVVGQLIGLREPWIVVRTLMRTPLRWARRG